MRRSIRDSMLAVSGQLDLKMHGRGFNLFDNAAVSAGSNPSRPSRPENTRRMIYAHKVRREPEAVFGAFDCPDAGQSTAVRRASTTPIQALNLFNSRFTLDPRRAFAITSAKGSRRRTSPNKSPAPTNSRSAENRHAKNSRNPRPKSASTASPRFACVVQLERVSFHP
jgi:hypothetical protein